jgi:outer membrane protein assembly factor BamE (lipoprotein component of BamABCDE complex)
MKKIFLLCAIAVGMLFLTTSCGHYVQYVNFKNSKKLRVDMTKKQVLSIMGEPVKNQQYASPNVWFYYTDMKWLDGLTTEDECLPLVFKDGKLAGWGWHYYEKIRIQHKFRHVD